MLPSRQLSLTSTRLINFHNNVSLIQALNCVTKNLTIKASSSTCIRTLSCHQYSKKKQFPDSRACKERCLNSIRPVYSSGNQGILGCASLASLSLLRSSRKLSTSSCVLAGHSKWANIRHTKGAKDAKKAAVALGIVKKMRAAIEGGTADPKTNPTLAKCIAEAQAKDIPNSTIEKAIKSAVLESERTNSVFIEGRGPGMTAIMIECSTHHVQKTRNLIASIFKTVGGKIGASGSVKHCFSEQAYVSVQVSPDDIKDLDSYVDIAIEAGAEDVTVEEFEGGEKYLRFGCEPANLMVVKANLEKRGLDILDYQSEFVPNTYVELSKEDSARLEKFYEKMKQVTGLERIYINVES